MNNMTSIVFRPRTVKELRDYLNQLPRTMDDAAVLMELADNPHTEVVISSDMTDNVPVRFLPIHTLGRSVKDNKVYLFHHW